MEQKLPLPPFSYEDALDHFYYNFHGSKGDTMPVYMFNLEDYKD